jgi:hypothetical protein
MFAVRVKKEKATFCGLLFALVRPRQMVAEMRRIHLFCSAAGITVSGHVLLLAPGYLPLTLHAPGVCVCWLLAELVLLPGDEEKTAGREQGKNPLCVTTDHFPSNFCYDTCSGARACFRPLISYKKPV